MRLRILVVLFLFILNNPVFSTDFTFNGSHISFNEKKKNTLELNKHWRFCIGDKTEWLNSKFDYSKWDTVFLPFTIEEFIPYNYKGNVWLRSTFVARQEHISIPQSFIVEQFGASEIYIDGKLIHQFGKVGNSLTTEEAYNPQNIPVSFTIDSVGIHNIIIRYSNHSSFSGNVSELEMDAFDLDIEDAETALSIHKIKILKKNILTSIGIGIFLTLGIINFILFLFYKRDKSSLYYSLFSIAVASTFMLSAIEYTCNTTYTALLNDKLQATFLFISNFFLLALVYSFIYNKTPKRLKIVLGVTLIGLCLILINFEFAKALSNVLNVYCVIDIVIVVLKSYTKKYDPTGKKRKRFWLIILSLVAIACLGFLIDKTIPIIILSILVMIIVIPIAGIIFIVPLYMTIRHAKNFSITNKSLEEQLVQVKELSEKAILQEQEKKKILESQNELLEVMVVERTAELAEKSNEIKDSINYARRIQRAILTSKEEINETLENYFILFKPKDIVSGDFYFYAKKEQTVFIAAADCTGHGVPGALMSMIGSEKLMSTVTESTSPSVILNLLNKGIKSSLRQSDHEESTKDGMDIALVSLNMQTNEASYAGANRPIWIIRNGTSEFEEIKATKKAIGGFTNDEQHFDQHELKFRKGDTFYLFTDGYADQFGYTGKKLMTKKFREILLSIQNLSMLEQEKYLNDFIEDWKKDAEQIDDILVIGVRI